MMTTSMATSGDPLAEFSADVVGVAQALPSWTGQAWVQAPGWQTHKVWICDVRAAFAATPSDFAAWLLCAMRAGLLRLSRADLAGAEDPAHFVASEVELLDARYHFVTI